MAVKLVAKRPMGVKAAPKRPVKAGECEKGHVPNAETAKVLRDARVGKNTLRSYATADEMFKDFGL